MTDLERWINKSNPYDDAVSELIGRYAPVATIDYTGTGFYSRNDSRNDIIKARMNYLYGISAHDALAIEKVIFNDPATIVIWKNGDKTVVKCQPGDTYDPEKGLALCIMKRTLGNKGNYNNVFRKWLPKKGE